ncbi:MAG: hypothetical protein RLY40_921 [Pseudomonadota bacterium]|jgi:hypothetical protein
MKTGSEIYEEINYDEDEDLDSEWDDEGSDISETLSIDAQNSENLGEESPSDSGISDEEIPSLEQHNPSNLPATSNFWKVRGTLAGQFRLGKSELPCLLPIQLGG